MNLRTTLAILCILIGLGSKLGVKVDVPGISLPSWVTTTASGPRNILIVHERGDDTPELTSTLAKLRLGTGAQYLTTKGHTLDVLDQDAQGPDGQPLAKLTALKPFTLPEMFIHDKASGKLLWRGKLPADPIAEVQRHGG